MDIDQINQLRKTCDFADNVIGFSFVGINKDVLIELLAETDRSLISIPTLMLRYLLDEAEARRSEL